MGPGIPGIGVTSIFYVLAGLTAPLRELVLTVRGRSSRARWRLVASQFSVAMLTVFAVVVFYLAVELAINHGWLADRRLRFSTVVPLWAYAFVALAVLLASLAIVNTIVRLTAKPDDPHAVARAHRLSVSDQLGIVESLGSRVQSVPKGRHLSSSERVAGRPFRSIRWADLDERTSVHEHRGRHLRQGRHSR